MSRSTSFTTTCVFALFLFGFTPNFFLIPLSAQKTNTHQWNDLVLNLENCSDISNCSDCTAADGCGWCDDGHGGVCFEGDENGPTDNSSCNTSEWRYSTCSDSELCGMNTNCEDCNKLEQCGWCDDVCVAGNASGPISPPHQCNLYLNDTCEAICFLYSDCTACTEADVGCGWCNVTKNPVCLKVDSITGDPVNGTCSASDWFIYDDMCHPPNSVNCSFNTCASCIENHECGWCETNKTCLPQDVGREMRCPVFKDWTTTCSGGCAQYQTCETCTTQTKCGFCRDACLEGGPEGPSSDYQCDTEDWLYGHCQLNCSQYNTCTDCTTTGGLCGWCSDQKNIGCFNSQRNCSSWSDSGCAVDGEDCAEFANCQECGEYQECAWCWWKENSVNKGRCVLEGNYTSLPSTRSCFLRCNKNADRPPTLKGGAIAGIVIGILLTLVAAFALAVFFYKKRSSQLSYDPIH